jgi:excisionase family DNA binding protein
MDTKKPTPPPPVDQPPPNPTPPRSGWLTVEEAAAVLRVGTKAIYAGIKSGDIRARKVGWAYRIAASEVLPPELDDPTCRKGRR